METTREPGGRGSASLSWPLSWPVNRFQRSRRWPGRAERRTARTRSLGWLSIGLGLTQLMAPQFVAASIGLASDRATLIRAIGLRQLVCGAGILNNERPVGWLLSRMGGDVMDLGLLAVAAGQRGNRQGRLAVAGVMVGGMLAIDALALQENRAARGVATPGVIRIEKVVSVNRPPEELYRFWRDFENLPRFMRHIESVTVTGPRRSHWKARGPGGQTVEWDAELTIDQPGQMLAWRSVEGAAVMNSGSVRFEPVAGGHGTVVHVDMHYSPPGGWLGALMAKLLGQDPATQIESDLRRFKQLLETGEIPTTEGQSAGRRGMLARLLHQRSMAGARA